MRFVQFLTEAGKWGVALMTGGILSFTLGFIEHLRGSSFPALTWTVVGFAAFMVGAFLAWRNERLKVEQLEEKQGRPDITAEFKLFSDVESTLPVWVLFLYNSSPRPAVDVSIEDVRNDDRVLRFMPPSSILQNTAGYLIRCGILYNGWTETGNVYSLLERHRYLTSMSPIFSLKIRFSSLDSSERKHWLLSGVFWYDFIAKRMVLTQQSIGLMK